MTDSTPSFSDHDRPRLRDDLLFQSEENDRHVAWLVDERRQRRIRMEGVGLALSRLLDGSRTPDQILRDLEREGTVIRRSLLDKTLAFFVEQGLLAGHGDGPSAGARTGRVALQDSAKEPRKFGTITVLDEARHNCVACGQCCRGYTFGPLGQDEVVRISEMSFEEDSARLARAERVVEYEYQGQTVPVLARREDGRCTFLAEDNRCIIHREHGAEAKPWFCQTFPLRFVASPDGSVSGYLQMECFGFHEASTHGPYLKDKADDVSRMISLVPHVPCLDEHVAVGGTRQLTFEEYRSVEKSMLDHVQSEPGDPGKSLVGIGQFLRSLEEGAQADGLLEAVTRENLENRDGSYEFVAAVSRFARSCLLDLYPPDIESVPRGATPEMQRFFLDALTYYGSEGDADEVVAADAIEGAEMHPECVSILRFFLRNEIFSKQWYRFGDLRRGFALTLVRHSLVRAGARVLARRWGETVVTPKALSHALSVVLRNLRGVLVDDASETTKSVLDRIYRAHVCRVR